jgi:phosphoribosylformylglycinamidine synthase I
MNTKDVRVAIIQFPGSNCDEDLHFAVNKVLGHQKTEKIWYTTEDWSGRFDAVLIPGGFSYGDFLRAGALAARSVALANIKKIHDKGGTVLGICNGFQILTESGLLPGALLKNNSGRFICQQTDLSLVTNSFSALKSPAWDRYFSEASANKSHSTSHSVRFPIAHGEGRYFLPSDSLALLKKNNQIFLQYKSTPNGSIEDIAGVRSESGRVFGLMPHPERAVNGFGESGTDGIGFLKAFLDFTAEVSPT